MLLALMGTYVLSADAQKRGGRVRSGDDTLQSPATQPQPQQPGFNPYAGIPIEIAPPTGGFNDTIRKSIRNDAPFDKNMITERTPLDYEHLRWDDALFTERIWREIDLREKINMPFRYKAEDDAGDLRFISILLNAVRKGDVTAFDANIDDRFTTPLSLEQVNGIISGGEPDTTPVYDLIDPTRIVKYVVTTRGFNPDDVMKIRIKEDWVFDREASRLFVRILGIAPLKTLFWQDGTERGVTPMFWIYYPDIRQALAKHEVYNPKNMGVGRITWEELFESRMFSSYIVKSSLDNPLNKQIRDFIKDPILRLLEGENIKERIFNYEQNLWSY